VSDRTDQPGDQTSVLPALVDLLGALARSQIDVTDVLQTLIERAVELARADQGDVAIREGDTWRAVAFTGMSEQFVQEHVDVSFNAGRGSMIGRALLDGKPIHVADVLTDPDYALGALQRVGGYRTVLAVPMIQDGSAIGVLAMMRNTVAPFSPAEIDVVSLFARHAGLALRVAELLSTVERQRSELARFAPHVASLLSTDEGQQLLAGHRREITALFCDLRGFTAFAESAEPEEVLGVLREYHSAVGELALAHQGTVEHFAGDGLMVFFNDPTPIPDHPAAAVRAALAMRERFGELARRWGRRGYELGLGIGVAVGYASLGRIGFEGRYDYGAVGSVVILASRLSDAAADGQILVSQRLVAALEDRLEADSLEPLALKGYARPVPVSAVRALLGG
jgi:class 3 adenylate cyclase